MRPAARFVLSFGAYVVLLLGSIWLLGTDALADSPWRPVVALLPVPAAAVMLGFFVERVRSLDELLRRQHLEALAVAFGGTLLVVFSWGFLEGVGVARLSGFVVFGVLMGLYLVGLFWSHRRYA